jgi:hypothetical protein
MAKAWRVLRNVSAMRNTKAAESAVIAAAAHFAVAQAPRGSLQSVSVNRASANAGSAVSATPGP